MFETSFPDIAQDGADLAPAQQSELRAFDWAELCARISASSELRRVVVAARRDGSFEGFACHPEPHSRPQFAGSGEHLSNGKRAVNLDVSIYGKAPAAKTLHVNQTKTLSGRNGDGQD